MQCIVNGLSKDAGNGKLFRIAEGAMDVLKTLLAKLFGKLVALKGIEGFLGYFLVKRSVAVAEKGIVFESHDQPPVCRYRNRSVYTILIHYICFIPSLQYTNTHIDTTGSKKRTAHF